MLSYQEIVPDIIAIKDGNVWMYLVKGRERAVLIDTGFGELSLETTVKALYDNHVIVCHTHTHHDHIGGDIFFSELYVAKEETDVIQNYLEMHHKSCHIHTLTGGQMIDLGNRKLEIIRLPGHTPGSLGFLDRKAKVLFSGDCISDRTIYMCLQGANLDSYRKSLIWIVAHQEWYDTILGCHGTPIQCIAQAETQIKCLELYKEGKIKCEDARTYTGENVKKIVYKEASFFVR